jgi:DNA-binding NtrC family response regulator
METIRVLLVDDEEDFRETLVKRLNRRNLEVTGAENGEEALKLIDTRPYDVVILDVKMPGMDGIETLREIKKRRPWTEVIMLTGHASVESGIEGMRLGAFDYLTKPCDINNLVLKVGDAYQRKLNQEGTAGLGK